MACRSPAETVTVAGGDAPRSSSGTAVRSAIRTSCRVTTAAPVRLRSTVKASPPDGASAPSVTVSSALSPSAAEASTSMLYSITAGTTLTATVLSVSWP